jgi:F-type H+-transporting ATPase subunit b
VISVNWTLGLQIFNFLLLLYILNTVLYRPLRAVLAKRKETIESDHGHARGLQQQIDEKMASYQERLQAARVKGNEERAILRAAASKEEAEILGAARLVATEKLQQLKTRVATEADAARTALRSDVDALATQVASRILGRAL